MYLTNIFKDYKQILNNQNFIDWRENHGWNRNFYEYI